MRVSPLLLTLVLAAGLATATLARAEEPACYDAQVSALIARQVPTDIPWCEGCHIMRWPWILDLRVERVLKGRAPDEPVTTVLAIQHSAFKKKARPERLWLRRNAIGLFNVVHFEDGETPRRCPTSAPPAKSYVALGPGESWKDRRRESELAARRSPWN